MAEASIIQKPVHWTGFYMIEATAMKGLSKIKEIRIGNANKVIIGNLNIYSIRNKFEQL